MAKLELQLDELVTILKKNNWLPDKVSSVTAEANKIKIKAKVMFTIDITVIFESYTDGILTLGLEAMPLVKPFITAKVQEPSVAKYIAFENDKFIIQLNKLADRKVKGLSVKELSLNDGNVVVVC